MNFNAHTFLKYPPGWQGYQDRMQIDKCIELYCKISEIIPPSWEGGAPQSNFGKRGFEWKL